MNHLFSDPAFASASSLERGLLLEKQGEKNEIKKIAASVAQNPAEMQKISTYLQGIKDQGGEVKIQDDFLNINGSVVSFDRKSFDFLLSSPPVQKKSVQSSGETTRSSSFIGRMIFGILGMPLSLLFALPIFIFLGAFLFDDDGGGYAIRSQDQERVVEFCFSNQINFDACEEIERSVHYYQ
ncbi:hypothetical protein COB57_02585 [Candidatus Peregrinibacteria bacterium]|nr:MAG: hypothetical protein COB57_02585 [Candidatus Peregrinibacteria bacterium]